MVEKEEPILRRTALQAVFVICYLYRGRCPRLLKVVPSRHRSACGFDFYHGFNGLDGSFPMRGWEQNKNKINPLERVEGGTPEDRGVLTTDRTDKSCGGRNGSKSLLLSPGLRPCSPMRMLSHESKLPCLSIHIRLVCRWQTRKATKQNSCPWQYKMSLHRRLLTVTSNL